MDSWINAIQGGWLYGTLPLITGWIMDRIFGDPDRLPHPVVWFGKAISCLERHLNRGIWRIMKGGLVSVGLTVTVFLVTWGLIHLCEPVGWLWFSVQAVGVFYCLAGTTLAREVRSVFLACDRGLEDGRRQVARIVGRDTDSLSEQEIKTAALETLAENLSDGVIAPLFWYALSGLPGMMAYKMINTLDSMIGYRNDRYREFGCVAARTDDVANYIPARLTALLITVAAGRPGLIAFVKRFGHCHASPNSGYPEAALAGALDCRFGGTHDYFGEAVYKPYIGEQERTFTSVDLHKSLRICLGAEVMMLVLTIAVSFLFC